MQTQSIFATYPILQTIPKEKFPKHVLIIPDGNGRWAEQEKKFVLQGHTKGAEVIKTLLRDISEVKEIAIITLWGFSADNWKRTEKEVNGLLKLIQYQIAATIAEVNDMGNRFVHVGRKDRLPKTLVQTMQTAEEKTKNNLGQIICVAVDFGGEDQEIRMLEQARHLPKDMPITQDILWQLRDTKGVIPPADLLIRTAGEKRTSDIGWLNNAQTELYFIEKFFPEIKTEDIVAALVDFAKRERRLGGRK